MGARSRRARHLKSTPLWRTAFCCDGLVLRRMARPPTFDLSTYRFRGTVRHRFSAPVYSEPYPYGSRVGHTFYGGETVGDLLEFRLSADGEYVSARTHIGWVNVWCLRNRSGRPRGVYFISVVGTMLNAATPAAPTAAADSADAGAGSGGSPPPAG